MPKWSKTDTTKTAPTKRGDIKLNHNLWETIGLALVERAKTGSFDDSNLQQFSANLGIDLGGGYGMDIGYNQYMKDIRQDLKIGVNYKFPVKKR